MSGTILALPRRAGNPFFGTQDISDVKQENMNKFAVVVAVFMFALPAFGAKGVVKHRISGCDYYLVALRSGYALLAWYAGYDPYKGDSLVGEFEEYRIHEIYDATRKDYTTARVVDYRLSKNSALEQLVEKCGTDYQE